MLDIFNSDAFSVIELTGAINLLPYKPGKIGSMGLFTVRPVSTTSVSIEYMGGKLSLVQSAMRGTMPRYNTKPGRKLKSFVVPHLPQNDAIMADDVQGVRAFGSEDQTEAIASKVNDKLESMKQNLEVTIEFHRIKALQGLILDADGSTMFDWFTEFGVSEPSVPFFGVNTDVKLQLLLVERTIETALGSVPYDYIHCFCGRDWFDMLISDSGVKAAYDRWNDGAMLRENQRKAPFTYAGVVFEEYRGKVGTQEFIPPGEARFIPMGVPDGFIEYYAPAPFMETVNTPGKPFYAKMQNMDFDVGVEIHSNSNPLLLPTRPEVLVKGTDAS